MSTDRPCADVNLTDGRSFRTPIEGIAQAETYITGLFAAFEQTETRGVVSRPVPAEFGLEGYFFRYERALLHKSGDGQGFPFPRTDLPHGFRYGSAERREAVQDGDTNLELGDLTVELARGEALARQLDAMHLGLCAASAVIAAPSSPYGSTDTLRCAQDLVAG